MKILLVKIPFIIGFLISKIKAKSCFALKCFLIRCGMPSSPLCLSFSFGWGPATYILQTDILWNHIDGNTYDSQWQVKKRFWLVAIYVPSCHHIVIMLLSVVMLSSIPTTDWNDRIPKVHCKFVLANISLHWVFKINHLWDSKFHA